jgi:hypothetical protein
MLRLHSPDQRQCEGTLDRLESIRNQEDTPIPIAVYTKGSWIALPSREVNF